MNNEIVVSATVVRRDGKWFARASVAQYGALASNTGEATSPAVAVHRAVEHAHRVLMARRAAGRAGGQA